MSVAASRRPRGGAAKRLLTALALLAGGDPDDWRGPCPVVAMQGP
jgi:hypothetical protein